MARINVNPFSSESMKEAIRQLNQYTQRILEVPADIVEEMCILGTNYAKVQTSSVKVDSSINYELKADGNGVIYADHPIAKYLEFGTGIIGADNPHPIAGDFGWQYDVNGHGEFGWWYPTDDTDPNPYKKIIDGSVYGWTRGQVGQRFMYSTAQYLRNDGYIQAINNAKAKNNMR